MLLQCTAFQCVCRTTIYDNASLEANLAELVCHDPATDGPCQNCTAATTMYSSSPPNVLRSLVRTTVHVHAEFGTPPPFVMSLHVHASSLHLCICLFRPQERCNPWSHRPISRPVCSPLLCSMPTWLRLSQLQHLPPPQVSKGVILCDIVSFQLLGVWLCMVVLCTVYMYERGELTILVHSYLVEFYIC